MTRAINDNLPGFVDRTFPLLTSQELITAVSRTGRTGVLQTTPITEETAADGRLTFEIAGIRVSIQTNAVGETLTTGEQAQLFQALSERDLFLQTNLLDVINGAVETDTEGSAGIVPQQGSALTERLAVVQELIERAEESRAGADVTQLERAAELLRLEMRQVLDVTSISTVLAQSAAGGLMAQPPRVDAANFEFRGIVVDAVA